MNIDIRNIAIIAHVDHGKTTLVNKLLEQSETFDEHLKLVDRVMDSDQIERERGITILAKNTSITYKQTRINILDTPGHADFSGEVERIMQMVDGVLLLVDAYDGVMPQTRFVLKKALESHLTPIVVVNKIDRPFANVQKTVNEVYDLFIDLGASEEQLDFPILYGSGLLGIINYEPEIETNNKMSALLDTVLDKVPAPSHDSTLPFKFQPALIDYNDYVGRMGIGKIYQGKVSVNETVNALRLDGTKLSFKIQKIIQSQGTNKIEVKEAYAGDIVSIAGLANIEVGETISSQQDDTRLKKLYVDEPTVQITFLTNDSPFAGLEGKNLTASKIESRLFKEAQKDVSLRVSRSSGSESWVVSGRGELHLSILIENMRRENFEFQVSRPQIINKEVDGILMEPYEKVVIDLPNEYAGTIIEMLGQKRGELILMNQAETFTRLDYIVPSKGLIGITTNFLTLTRGYGIINSSFLEYRPFENTEIVNRKIGSLISINEGQTTAYALGRLEDRGLMFVSPRTNVYEGMIVGENNKDNDLVVNVTQEKQLTNMRAASKDQTVVLKKAKQMFLEDCMAFINDDELIEITPKSIRIRKKYLKAFERKRN